MKKNLNLRLVSILLLGIMAVSACTQPYSQAPLASPTLLPTGLFVSPFPSGQDPLQIVADLGTQTAMAKTNVANGTTTPATPGTPGTSVTSTVGTPLTPTLTPTLGTPITVVVTTPVPVTVIVGGSTATPYSTVFVATPVSAPATYTLKQGEFVFCIARRFNLNPDDILSMNGLFDSQTIYPGLTLKLPQSGAFPGDRTLHSHPDTYTVSGNNDTTLNGVACYYGDVFPEAISSANNLPLSTTLNIGQQIKIP
jgi:LysM repeat protein